MLSVIASLQRVLVAAVVAAATTASSAFVAWSAPAPGADLQPDNAAAAEAIQLTQVGDWVLWASKVGTVANVTTYGWPTIIGDDELGGVMVVDAFYRTSGTVTIGEPPESVSFQFEG